MTIRKRWQELKRRWPAVVSILRDGTVLYQARIIKGTVHMNRPHSTIIDCVVEGNTGAGIQITASTPNVHIDQKPGTLT